MTEQRYRVRLSWINMDNEGIRLADQATRNARWLSVKADWEVVRMRGWKNMSQEKSDLVMSGWQRE